MDYSNSINTSCPNCGATVSTEICPYCNAPTGINNIVAPIAEIDNDITIMKT